MSAWIWLVIALGFVLIEVTNFAFFAVFLAAGSLAAAIASAAGAGLIPEVIVFAAVTVGGVLLARGPALAALESRSGKQLISGARGLVGQEAIVVERVLGHHPPGVVRARGEDWPAVSYDPDPHEPGDVVLIVDLEKTRFVITRT